jgi:hypothetical protein
MLSAEIFCYRHVPAESESESEFVSCNIQLLFKLLRTSIALTYIDRMRSTYCGTARSRCTSLHPTQLNIDYNKGFDQMRQRGSCATAVISGVSERFRARNHCERTFVNIKNCLMHITRHYKEFNQLVASKTWRKCGDIRTLLRRAGSVSE